MDFLLTQKSVGPFNAGVHTSVPLWMGLYLRKRNLCRLVAPPWLSVTFLKDVLSFERDPRNSDFYDPRKLPFRYAEVSRAILQTCGVARSAVHAGGENEELPQAEQILVLLEDIAMVRMEKTRRNIHEMSATTMSKDRPMPVIKVTGIAALEIGSIKPFLERSFGDHLKLVRAGASDRTNSSKRSTGTGDDRTGLGASDSQSLSAPAVAAARSRTRRFR